MPNIYRLFESIEIPVSPIVSLHVKSMIELSLKIRGQKKVQLSVSLLN